MFLLTLLFSLIHWGRATKSCLRQLQILQNIFIRASLFYQKPLLLICCGLNFRVLKLNEMFKIENAKFLLEFKNKLLPISFVIYFTNLNEIHQHDNRQKAKRGYYYHSLNSEFGSRRLYHECLTVWKSIPLTKNECSFSKFKKVVFVNCQYICLVLYQHIYCLRVIITSSN